MEATLIFNPIAGQRQVREMLYTTVGRLVEAGWSVRWRETTPEIGATAVAKQAIAEGSQVLLAAGGDGTINEVINGMVGSGARLGVLPVGTANLWAVESGIASAPVLMAQDLNAATDVLLNGTTVAVDLGRAGSRYFLLMAGIGFDALVTRQVEPQIKRRVGGLAYAWTAVREGWGFRGVPATIRVDETVIRCRTVLVAISNTRLYAGVPLAPDANPTDGLFDVTIFTGRGWPALLGHAVRVVARSHPGDPTVHSLRGRTVEIRSHPALPVQVDAEPIGETPMTFTIVPQALPVIVSDQMAASMAL